MSDRHDEPAHGNPPAEHASDVLPATRSPVDPLIGRTIEGRFEILSQLARGGMGAIYKARQVQLGRICAVKVMISTYDETVDPLFQKRFFLEASTAAKLTHPNTVKIFDYGKTSDDIYFIAMEFIEGRTLFRVLREEGPLEESRASHIAQQICRSLREAHALDVVHRDLKPGNVLIVDRPDEQDTVKVLDFGLVKDLSGERSQVTQAGLRMGSPKYMAPEQAMGEAITSRTDIYSLGVLLFEMLCGRVPFDKRRAAATAIAHVHEPVPPMRSFHPTLQVSAAMEAIVYRCLLKDAARRFASMQEVLDALKSAAGMNDAFARSSMLPDASHMAAGSGRHPLPSIPPPLPEPRAPEVLSSRSGPPGPDVDSAPPSSTLPAAKPKAPLPAEGGSSLSRLARTDPPRKMGPIVMVSVLALVGIAVLTKVLGARSSAATLEDSASGAVPAAIIAATADQVPAASAPVMAAPPVHVESEPAGASVSEGGAKLCEATPCDVPRRATGEARRLTIEKVGFQPVTLDVRPAETRAVVKLSPLVVVTAPVRAEPAATGSSYKPSPY